MAISLRALRVTARPLFLRNRFPSISLRHLQTVVQRDTSLHSNDMVSPSLNNANVAHKPEANTNTSSDDPRAIIKAFFTEHKIEVKGSDAQTMQPVLNFDSTPFSEKLKKALISQGYTAPTPIQSVAWALASEGRDMIAVAKTGSGKTCGFLLPAMNSLDTMPKPEKQRPGKTLPSQARYRPPSMLVLAPTRELAVQIQAEATKFTRSLGLVAGCVYGGASRGVQIDMLRRGVDIVIATPGRCNDLAELGALNLTQIKYLVLDEADRMLDMGFEPQIRQIVEQLPEQRQSLFFTATWPKEVQGLAVDFLKDPVRVNVGDADQLNANTSITQNVKVISEYDKPSELVNLLEEIRGGAEKPPSALPKTLIFVSRKSSCEEIANDLHELGYRAEAIHGDKSQDRRSRCLDLFRSGRVRVLVATDVVSRGIDVRDIEHVINYDFPSDGVESYVHRIGRTGRAGATGTSHTFFTSGDAANAAALVGVLERCQQEVPMELRSLIPRRAMPQRSRYGSGGGGGGGFQRSTSYSNSNQRFSNNRPRFGGEYQPERDMSWRRGDRAQRDGGGRRFRRDVGYSDDE